MPGTGFLALDNGPLGATRRHSPCRSDWDGRSEWGIRRGSSSFSEAVFFVEGGMVGTLVPNSGVVIVTYRYRRMVRQLFHFVDWLSATVPFAQRGVHAH